MPAAGDVHGTGDFDFKSFFLDIPPVTRTLFIGVFLSTVLSGLGVLPVSMFLLDWYPIIAGFQIWRIFLTFFHMGGLGLKFLIKLYFLFTYSKQLEVGVFFARPANYAWFLTFVACFVLVCTSLMPSLVNAGAFLTAIIHLWGRHAENVTVTLYGFISIPAKYLSLAMLLLDVIINGGVSSGDVMGLLGGHLYYFLDSVYPRMPNGKATIFVPIWFERLVERLQDGLGQLTGLQSGTPAPPESRSGPGRVSSTSGVSGQIRGGAGTSGARSGLTMPSMRGGHKWGSGRTLGS